MDLDVPIANGAATRAARGNEKAGLALPVVLIVDDDADNVFALQAMLQRDGVEFVGALSAYEALDVLLARDVAVAIIDVQMPEMDGFELATIMRGIQKTHNVPIVFVTAGAREQFRVFRGYECGAVDCLFKPIDPRIIKSKVDVFVRLEEQRLEILHDAHMRELFMGVLGHDLRNPLSGILMSVQMMMRQANDAATEEALRRITRNGNRILRMVNQLLDVSLFRLGGGVKLTPRWVDLREVTEQILGEFVHLRERFHLDVQGDTTGIWDKDRLLQVVSNLVGNAVQHSPLGSPILVRLDGARADRIVFQLHNGGPTIPDALRAVLFEPFRGSADERQRLGLGLYIANQLVLAHGGQLSCESNEATGTWFTVMLPRHSARGSEAERPCVAEPRPAAIASRRAERTVLIVEDEPVARLALGQLIAELGYRVLVAADPNEAMEVVDAYARPVHLLLTDLRLPEMNGEQLAARLREVTPTIQVVFMSGLPAPPSSDCVFLRKPIDFDQLTNVLDRALTLLPELARC